MPFGGRRGGGGPKGPAGLDWEIKYEGISWKPEKRWPPMQRVISAPIKPHEIDEINRFRNFRDQIRESPIYTVRGRPKVHKPDAAFDKRANDAPFMPMDYGRTYTSRYYRPKRTLPDLTTRPYALQFIPEELHYLLGVNENKANGTAGGATETTKKLDIADDNWQSRLDRMAEEEEPPEDYDENENEDDENKSNKDNEDDPDAVEDLEDDESDNDDYNAERYFDGGEDDDGDDGGGGGGGGGNDDYGGGGDDYD